MVRVAMCFSTAVRVAAVMVWMAVTGMQAGAQTLNEELRGIDALRKGEMTNFRVVDSRCKNLLEKYPDPDSQGKIYFKWAVTYAQTVLRVMPNETITYIRQALECPLNPVDRLQLYVYWGDAIQVAHAGVRGAKLGEARVEAVMPYLLGLKEALKYKLPDQMPAMPPAGFLNMEPTDTEEYRLEKRKHDAEVESQKLAWFQREMIRHRDALTGQIAFMYSRMPFATEEVRTLATRTLEDRAAVEKLMAAVEQAMRDRVKDLVAKEMDVNELAKDFACSSAAIGKPHLLPSAQGRDVNGEVEQMLRRDASVLLPVEAEPWRVSLVRKIAAESVEQSIDNLPHFDDMHLAQTSVGGGMAPVTSNGVFQAICVTRLARVRKLMAIGQEYPESIVPLLRKNLTEAITGFDAARDEFDSKLKASGKDFVIMREPCDVMKRQTYCIASTYLLTELRDHETLPLLAQVCRDKLYRNPSVAMMPAPVDYAAYAMYQMINDFPREALNEQQVAALDAAVEAGKDIMLPTGGQVTKWSDVLAEHDLRATVMRQDLKLDMHPKVTMRNWNLRYTDGARMASPGGRPSARLKALFDKMDLFVKSVYPDK